MHRSLIRICKTEIANFESLETSWRYCISAVLCSLLRGGVGHSSTSSGNLSSRPIATRLLGISVLSMGAPFQAYCDVFAFCRYVK